jgi:hypothetical protein
MGRISPDFICRTYGVVSSLSGKPVVMSGLAIVRGAHISVVTRLVSYSSLDVQAVLAVLLRHANRVTRRRV